MANPHPYNVRNAAFLVIFGGLVALLVSLFSEGNRVPLAVGTALLLGGLLLRIEAAVLQISTPGPPPPRRRRRPAPPETSGRRPWEEPPEPDADA